MKNHMNKAMALSLLISLTCVNPGAAASQELTVVAHAILAGNKIKSQTNEYRQRNGLPVLSSSNRLNAAAKAYANFLAQNNATGHEADGSTADARMAAQGYQACAWAENVYDLPSANGLLPWQQATAIAMAGWIKSPGHDANLKNAKVTDIGVGVAAWQHGNRSYYKFVQVFGDDCSDSPEATVVKRLGKKKP